jgi:hypothetical protein
LNELGPNDGALSPHVIHIGSFILSGHGPTVRQPCPNSFSSYCMLAELDRLSSAELYIFLQ